MAEAIFLEVKWSVSKGRETYGYNICTLTDTSTGKRFRCNGGGYDMLGTVLGEWLQETHQEALRSIADQAYDQVQQRLAGDGDPDDGPATINDRTRNDKGFYGMTTHRSPRMTRAWVRLDGACGIESMRRIAEAIGLHVKSVSGHGDRHIGYIVTEGERS